MAGRYCFMLIKDDMLREVIARTLRITEEEITEEKLLEREFDS